jgi:hypothetical protein
LQELAQPIGEAGGFQYKTVQFLENGGVAVGLIMLLVSDALGRNQPADFQLCQFSFNGACARTDMFHDLARIKAAIGTSEDEG